VQLGRLLTEIPPAYQPLYVLLASTGLRISEAIALRWCDLDLEASPPRLQVRRAIVRGVVGALKSYYGARAIPLAEELAGRLRALRPPTQRTRTSCSLTAAGGHLTRTLVARDVEESSGQMPLAVIGWHLSRRLADPLLVIAASPRLRSDVSPTGEIIIETGFQLLVEVLLYVASDHRAWVLERLPKGTRRRESRSRARRPAVRRRGPGRLGCVSTRALWCAAQRQGAGRGRSEAAAAGAVTPARVRMASAASVPIASRISLISAAS
jgi:hypothetical protein